MVLVSARLYAAPHAFQGTGLQPVGFPAAVVELHSGMVGYLHGVQALVSGGKQHLAGRKGNKVRGVAVQHVLHALLRSFAVFSEVLPGGAVVMDDGNPVAAASVRALHLQPCLYCRHEGFAVVQQPYAWHLVGVDAFSLVEILVLAHHPLLGAEVHTSVPGFYQGSTAVAGLHGVVRKIYLHGAVRKLHHVGLPVGTFINDVAACPGAPVVVTAGRHYAASFSALAVKIVVPERCHEKQGAVVQYAGVDGGVAHIGLHSVDLSLFRSHDHLRGGPVDEVVAETAENARSHLPALVEHDIRPVRQGFDPGIERLVLLFREIGRNQGRCLQQLVIAPYRFQAAVFLHSGMRVQLVLFRIHLVLGMDSHHLAEARKPR